MTRNGSSDTARFAYHFAVTNLKPFTSFFDTIAQTANEQQKREAFLVLAANGFDDTDLANSLALGAEYTVHFSKAGLIRRGAIDTFFGNLIIEFEYVLEKTRAHALDQLRGYVAGAWTEDGNTDRPYLAVATDGLVWEIYAPFIINGSKPAAADNVELDFIDGWRPTGEALDDGQTLRDFLNRLLFRKTLLAPTTDNFTRDFGLSSPAYLRIRADLLKKLEQLGVDSQLHVLQGSWRESLQLAYGSIETDDALFAKHTYLAVLARLLVWAALEQRPLQPGEANDVLSGVYFQGRNVSNLVEDDFFRWYSIGGTTDLDQSLTALSRQLAGYNLAAVREDILKPLYEELVDPATRHELGEFYTPDWLAHRLVARLLQQHDFSTGVPAVIDPACGSGTFVRTVIDYVRASAKWSTPADALEDIRSKIVGLDVHPLAVIVARATYLLAVKDLLPAATSPVAIPIYLANALSMPPVERQMLFGRREFVLVVDDTEYHVPEDLIYHGADYDDAIEDVLSVARSYGNPETKLQDAPASLKNLIGTRFDKYDSTGDLAEKLGMMAKHIAKLIRARRNSVHGFMLRNHYRPSMLRATFDFVVGNPPWLTVASIGTATYKQRVIELAAASGVASRATGEQSHTELATIFLAAAAEHYVNLSLPLKDRIGFVMPRSVMTAKHHEPIRQGKYAAAFNITEIWDLADVTPLFNIPSCVIIARPGEKPRPTEIKNGLQLQGKLRGKDLPVAQAEQSVAATKVQYALSYLGKRSTWAVAGQGKGTAAAATQHQHYVTKFRQGAVLYPQTLFVVKPQSGIVNRTAKSVLVKTDPDATESAKVLAKAKVNHVVETTNLFFTAAADHIVPYALTPSPWVVVLPVISDPGTKTFRPVDSDTLRKAGRVKTAEWLDWAQKQWEKARKKDEKTPLHERLDFATQLSCQAATKRYVTIYTAAGMRTVACVIDTKQLSLPFVARDRTYVASFATRDEADYLTAMLNSDYAADYIGEWINRGLFGKRDINKRILDVPWPPFDAHDVMHAELVAVSAALALEAAKLVANVPSTTAGLERKWVRSNLDAGKLARAEELVAEISGSGVGKIVTPSVTLPAAKELLKGATMGSGANASKK